MTPRLPWLLPARLRYAPGGHLPPRPAAGPVERDREATDTRYPERFTPGTPLWLAREAIVLARLADHGGDYAAHKAVHQPKETR